MSTLVRDLVIFVGVLIALTLFNAARSRGARRRTVSGRAQGGGVSPDTIDGLTEYAASQGWAGPSKDLSSENMARDYVEDMLRSLAGAPRGGADVAVSGPVYEDLYSGQVAGRNFLIGNAGIGVAGRERAGSLCILHLGELLPPLFVNLRRYHPYVRILLKEVPFESEAFNRRFSVLAVDREYAMDVITERSMAILMERDDWVFALEFDRLVCVANGGLASVKDYADRLDAVIRFADLIPPFVEQDKALRLPALPDGTVLDPADPASRERFKEALLAMTPEQREQVIAQARADGARFLIGMLGSRVPPEVVARLQERAGTVAPDPDATAHEPGTTA
jgi:hypothetical protein